MQKVSVRGADGQKAILALIRSEGATTFVCPIGRYSEAKAGADIVVGFPAKDVELIDQSASPITH